MNSGRFFLKEIFGIILLSNKYTRIVGNLVQEQTIFM